MYMSVNIKLYIIELAILCILCTYIIICIIYLYVYMHILDTLYFSSFLESQSLEFHCLRWSPVRQSCFFYEGDFTVSSGSLRNPDCLFQTIFFNRPIFGIFPLARSKFGSSWPIFHTAWNFDELYYLRVVIFRQTFQIWGICMNQSLEDLHDMNAFHLSPEGFNSKKPLQIHGFPWHF